MVPKQTTVVVRGGQFILPASKDLAQERNVLVQQILSHDLVSWCCGIDPMACTADQMTGELQETYRKKLTEKLGPKHISQTMTSESGTCPPATPRILMRLTPTLANPCTPAVRDTLPRYTGKLTFRIHAPFVTTRGHERHYLLPKYVA